MVQKCIGYDLGCFDKHVPTFLITPKRWPKRVAADDRGLKMLRLEVATQAIQRLLAAVFQRLEVKVRRFIRG